LDDAELRSKELRTDSVRSCFDRNEVLAHFKSNARMRDVGFYQVEWISAAIPQQVPYALSRMSRFPWWIAW
jgi:hypothetical protein